MNGTERNPVYVDITNVAHWFYSVNSQEVYDIATDFPCLAVPWPFSQWEWRQPRFMNVEGQRKDTRISSLEFLARAISLPCNNDDALTNQPLQLLRRIRPGLKLDERGDSYQKHRRHLLSEIAEREISSFVSYGITISKPREVFLGVITLYLDYYGLPVGWPQIFGGDGLMQMPTEVAKESATLAYPIMYATSLLHCKNIELRDKKYSRQVLRQAARKGQELIKYKELVIEPFKKQVRAETAGTNESEIHRALHICRGHFATYSEERPLFGKHTGTFWKPMHVRGSKEYGEVRKSYRVDVE